MELLGPLYSCPVSGAICNKNISEFLKHFKECPASKYDKYDPKKINFFEKYKRYE